MATVARFKLSWLPLTTVLLLLCLGTSLGAKKEQDPEEAMQQVAMVMGMVHALSGKPGPPPLPPGYHPPGGQQGTPYMFANPNMPGGMGGMDSFGGGMGGMGGMGGGYQGAMFPQYGMPMNGFNGYNGFEGMDYVEEDDEKPQKGRGSRNRGRRPQRSRSQESKDDENEPLSFRNVFTTFVRNLGWAFTSDNQKRRK